MLNLKKEASLTRDYGSQTTATLRAACPDPSLRKDRLLGMTIKLKHYQRGVVLRPSAAAC
ncbi:MAG: hypothetical protein WCA92_21085 [Terriglobales bacterium]